MDDRMVVVTRTPEEPVAVLGPFDDSSDALLWADAHLHGKDYWVVPLTLPKTN